MRCLPCSHSYILCLFVLSKKQKVETQEREYMELAQGTRQVGDEGGSASPDGWMVETKESTRHRDEQQEIDEMGYKGVCIHDREEKRARVMKERGGGCVGSNELDDEECKTASRPHSGYVVGGM